MADPRPSSTTDLYTALVALTLLAVLFTAGFVAYQCLTDYGTLIKIAG